MASFAVKSRKTSPVAITTVEAETREAAIAQTLETAAEGEEIEIMDAREIPAAAPPPVEPPPARDARSER